MSKWNRLPNETSKAFSAFQLYLETRSCQKVADRLSITRQAVQKWYSKFDWKNRSIAYDNSILEDKRQAFASRYSEFLEKQFALNEKIQADILSLFEQRHMSKINWKTLNEIYRSNFAEMLKIAEIFALGAEEDKALTIKILTTDKSGA